MYDFGALLSMFRRQFAGGGYTLGRGLRGGMPYVREHRRRRNKRNEMAFQSRKRNRS